MTVQSHNPAWPCKDPCRISRRRWFIQIAATPIISKRQFVEAIADHSEAIRLNSQLCAAVDNLHKVIELNPEFAGAYMNRANNYVRQGELDNAISDYNAALLRDPNLADVYISRGNIFLRKKDYRHALPDLQAAVQMKIKKPERALNSLAWLRATRPEAGIHQQKGGGRTGVEGMRIIRMERFGHH